MKNKIFVLTIGLILNCSCENKTVQFIYLDKLSGEVKSPTNGYEYYYGENFLIDHPPKNNDELKRVIIQYRDSMGKNVSVLDEKYGAYCIYFYRKTSNTSYFIDHEEDYGGFSVEVINDYKQDYLGSICYERCKDDSTKWLSTIYLVLKADEYGVLESRTDTLKNECKEGVGKEKKEYVYPLE